MAIAGVGAGRFDGVAHGVAVVEDGAQAGFAFVGLDYPGFDLHVAGDQPVELIRIQFQGDDLLQVLFEEGE